MTTTTINSISDPTTATPAEIDTKLAALWEAEQKQRFYLASVKSSLESPRFNEHQRDQFEALVEQYVVEIARLRIEARPLEDEYASRPWRRYFLVVNSNGHVHRGMNCTTCYDTTQYAWLPELSGCDEAAMIEEFGEKACTVCFPDAPANPHFNGPGRRDAEAKAERERERAERQAKKDAKNLPGGPVRIEYSTVTTKIAARNALSGAVQSYVWYGPSHPHDFLAEIKALVAALEPVEEIDTAKVIASAVKRAQKDGGEHKLPEVLA